MDHTWRSRLAGGAAGLANGLFGGGGGMVFLPLMSRSSTLTQRQLFATCVAIIFPICLISAGIALWNGQVDLLTALPYLLGGLGGGIVGGATFEKVSVRWLKLIFGAFLLYGGVKYLL